MPRAKFFNNQVMSANRRNTRSTNSGQKRKTSGEPEKLESSKTRKTDVSEQSIPAEKDGNKKTTTGVASNLNVQESHMDKTQDMQKCQYQDVKRRAIAARRRLDSLIRHRRNVQSVKTSMNKLKKEICQRLGAINDRLVSLEASSRRMEEEFKQLNMVLASEHNHHVSTEETTPGIKTPKKSRPQTVVVSVPQHEDSLRDEDGSEDTEHHGSEDLETIVVDPKAGNDSSGTVPTIGSNFTFITLNNEEDYPDGSWLGDEHNAQMRVRCHISPNDMLHIMNMCKTAEKCALKLLDYLFDRETQAMSNLSGTGKHKKRKLDPLIIYGIHCHLVKHFTINDEDWYRIRQNIDSKCRTAFRRKQKGLGLYPKNAPRLSKKTPVSIGGTTFTTQDYHTSSIQHIQHVVNHLQSLPGASLAGIPTGDIERITIIQEQPDGTSTVETTSPSLAGHTILPHQLKEVIHQAANASEIHLSTGQTIAISQTGELEIREVHVEEAK